MKIRNALFLLLMGGLLFLALYAEAADLGQFGGGNGRGDTMAEIVRLFKGGDGRGDAMAEILGYMMNSITVTSPNGGESWIVGTAHDITWTTTGTIANVRIEYSTNNGTNWIDVSASTPNDGSYSWTIPGSPSAACLIRISDVADPFMTDSSNAAFTIADTVPDAFTLIDQTGMPLGTAIESNPITVAGINALTAISITGGEYAISGDGGSTWGSWTSATGTVRLNDRVKVRLMSSANYATLTTATLTIGGVSEAFHVTTAASGDPSANGLFSWWKAESNAFDSVGGHHGTPHGAITYSMGMVGQAFNLNGSSHISTADSPAWDFGTGDFTIDAWINTPVPVNRNRLISAGNHLDGAYNLWTVGYGSLGSWGTGNRLNFAYYNGTGYIDVNSDEITLTANAFHHITVVRSGTNMIFYFNGVQAGIRDVGTVTLNGGSTGAIIGARYFRNPSEIIEYATGLIDELQIYDRALSADEVGILSGTLTVISPNGGESWMVGTAHDITWSAGSSVGSLNIDYSTDGGSAWTSIATGTANDGIFNWASIPNTLSSTCLVRVQEADGSPSDISDAVFSIVAFSAETVSVPTTPSGPATGTVGTSYAYSTGGSTSSLGHSLQYFFDWDDGSDSGWLAEGTTTAAHGWLAAGTYHVRAKARCVVDTGVESAWSATLPVTLDEAPTWVAVSRFAACESESQPTVEWHTASELGAVGFNLWRQNRETKLFELVNPSLLPALANSPQGGVYRFADPGAFPGEPVTYRLEEVNAQGRTMSYGPFTVTFGGYAQPDIIDPGMRLGKEEDSGIYGFQRLEREGSLYEQERLDARRREQQKGAELAASQGSRRVRITVKGRGLFYIATAQFAGQLGMSQNAAAALISGHNLNLTGLGRDIPWLADANGAGLFFYNEGLETVYSDHNVYFLEPGRGLAMETLNGGSAGPADPGQSYEDTLHVEGNRYALLLPSMNPAGDLWFWDYIIAGAAAKSFPIQVFGVAGTGKAVLTVSLHGATDTAASDDHHAVISLNGRPIGDAAWDGAKAHEFTVAFAASLLQEGANSITVSGALDMGAPHSIFYVQAFDLSYQRHYKAVDNSLVCRGHGNSVVTVSGLTEPQAVVLDVTTPDKPRQLTGIAPDVSGRVTFVPRADDNTYLVSGLNASLRPLAVEGDRSAQLKGTGNSAEYVVIAPEEFVETARKLANFRKNKGLKSMVVTLEDIYDTFNHGVPSPLAIRDFLAHAYAKWSGKKVKFAVLAGKGTYDYNDYKGQGDNLVPAIMARTPEGLCAADKVFGDVSGKDGLPEIAIGRLPAVTNAELQGMIDKIKAYESGQGAWTDKTLWIADNADDGGDFAQSSNGLASLATGYQAEKVYLNGAAAETRARINAAWNAGAALVNYCGHAGIDQLAVENLFNAGDARALHNGGQLPLAVMLTCVAGRFELPGFTSLGEALVLNPNGGAAGGLMPSGAAFNADSVRLAEEFYKAVFRGKEASAGKALLAAMKSYLQSGGKASLLNVYNWLGDPAVSCK